MSLAQSQVFDFFSLRSNEAASTNLSKELDRFENERNGCEALLEQSKLIDRFFSDTQMNDLTMLTRFFQFLQQSMTKTRQNAAKLVLRLPGSRLLELAYERLKPSPMSDEENKKLLDKFVLSLSKVLQSLIELHPHCYDQLDSLGIFDRLEKYTLGRPVCEYRIKNSFERLVFVE